MQKSSPTCSGQYNIFPSFPVEPGAISSGYAALVQQIASLMEAAGDRTVIIDGYGGVLWDALREGLDQALAQLGFRAAWTDVQRALKPEAEIDRLAAPFLGGDDPVFGTRFTGELADFFNADQLAALRPDPSAGVNILYGPGSALAGWQGWLRTWQSGSSSRK